MIISAIWLAILGTLPTADPAPTVTFKTGQDQVAIQINGRPFATYSYRDDKILRPYFAHVFAPNGEPVTRRFPPDPNKDRVDHSDMHPGLWWAFGDLGGGDFWRNRGIVAGERFVKPPSDGAVGSFTVVNRYVADGKLLCRETQTIAIAPRPAGWLMAVDSTFDAEPPGFAFGDQEEMGLGVRLSTPLIVKNGGRILNSAGARNEKGVRGQQSAWCDYSGPSEKGVVGVAIFADPQNPRLPRWHARDYGLLVANPFADQAFDEQAPARRTAVAAGALSRWRFGVLTHGDLDAAALEAAYIDFQRWIVERDAREGTKPSTGDKQ